MAGQLTQADIDAMSRARKAFLAAIASDDVNGMMALLTDDGQAFPPHEPPVMGAAANRAWHQARVAKFNTQITTSTDEVVGDGTVAYERLSYTMTLTPKAGGDAIEDRGNCFWLWRRESDGSWKVARSMWNSPQPIPAS